MVRTVTGYARALGVGALCALAGGVARGQAPAPGTGDPMVLDAVAFTSFVENMDRSLAFYHDVFGMDVPAMPASGMRPYNNPNPGLFAFFDIAGAKERHQSARVKGIRTPVEVMEVMFCRGAEDLRRCAPALARYFLPRGSLGFLIDGDMETRLSHYQEGREPRYFKGPYRPVLGDLAYTEKAVFG